MIVNVKFHSCLNHTPLTFTLPPSLKLRPSLNPLIEKSVLKTMDQDWVTFYFLSGSHLWLILTSVFVIKQSAQRPCWPVPSLLLIFPPKLFFCQTFALANPPRRSSGPQTVTQRAALRMCASCLRFDPDRATGCYTQARKRVASHYLPLFRFGLDGTAVRHETDTFPFNSSWRFATLSLRRNGAISCALRCVWRHWFLSSCWVLLISFKILPASLIPTDALYQ